MDAFIIDAAHFVPQSRQRLFVVGQKIKVTILIRDSPKFFESDTRPAALADFILWHPEINWRIRSLPPLPSSHQKLDDILENLPPNSQMWWNQERCDYLLNQMSPKHRATARKDDSRFQNLLRHHFPPGPKQQIHGRVAHGWNCGFTCALPRVAVASSDFIRRRSGAGFSPSDC